MCYIRKTFYKKDIEDGMLLEMVDIKTQDKKRFLVLKSGVIRSGNVAKYEKCVLVCEEGYALSIDEFDEVLRCEDLVLSKVYGLVMYRKVKNKKIDLYSSNYRELIYKKDIYFMTEKDCLRLLASKFDKHIVII